MSKPTERQLHWLIGYSASGDVPTFDPNGANHKQRMRDRTYTALKNKGLVKPGPWGPRLTSDGYRAIVQAYFDKGSKCLPLPPSQWEHDHPEEYAELKAFCLDLRAKVSVAAE